ncbi:MAG: threonine/serine exporter family protein [Rhodospirillales bacterium]|nr:threonine/serine exporter family protein [Rhodospirillales bacterium]
MEATRAAQLCLLLGEMLFSFGATTRRIQDSVARLARHLECKVELLVNYDALMITVHDRSSFRTRIACSRGSAALNLHGLARVSEWGSGVVGPAAGSAGIGSSPVRHPG